MQIRFLSHGSTHSSRSVSGRLKYNLAGETIDPSTLLVKNFHIAHVHEHLVAGEAPQTDVIVDRNIICTGSGSPPIPYGNPGATSNGDPLAGSWLLRQVRILTGTGSLHHDQGSQPPERCRTFGRLQPTAQTPSTPKQTESRVIAGARCRSMSKASAEKPANRTQLSTIF